MLLGRLHSVLNFSILIIVYVQTQVVVERAPALNTRQKVDAPTDLGCLRSSHDMASNTVPSLEFSTQSIYEGASSRVIVLQPLSG